MKKVVAIGVQDFAQMRENDYFYIDKTGFIRDRYRIFIIPGL